MSVQMKSAFLGHTTTILHIFGTIHTKPPDTSQEFWINTNALKIVVLFYVTSATVFFLSISLIEISQLEKLYSPVNMSVGTNMLINGKLDNTFLSFVCAKLSLNVTSMTVELPPYIFWKLNSYRIQSYLWNFLKSYCRTDIKRNTQKHCFA